MSEKYLNIDLNDPRASAIADVMGNKTAKRMLDIIAEKEVSESDIASELKIPLNTVGYNIDKLLKAGLIEKSSNFFWSVKGKKIPTYKLSNKKILISPKRLTIAPIAMIASIIGAIALIVLFMNMSGDNSTITSDENDTIVSGNLSGAYALKQFSSYEELNEFLNESISQNSNNNYYRGSGMMETIAFAADSSAGSASNTAKSSGADSYSKTNIQVEGVDEPDFVKNDDKYIYMISGQNLYIVLAYPADEMKILANISLSNYATNMFVNGNKLVVFSNGYKEYETLGTLEGISSKMMAADSMVPCYGYRCGGYSKPLTNVIVYDISNRENPIEESNYSFDGSYTDARMIGDYIYTISQNYIYGSDYPMPLYAVNGVERNVLVSDIYYSPEFDNSFVFTSVSAINLDDEEVNTKVYLLGTSGTIYVSENNIYLTSQKYISYTQQIELKIKEGIIPVMPDEYQDKINDVLESDIEPYTKQTKVMNLVYNYSNNLEKEEQSDFNIKLQKSLDDAEMKVAKEQQKTIIHKISINGMDIVYYAEGEVIGHLLNQFSLDEYDENLRVAVTSGEVWGGNSLNHIFVLNKELEVIGSVEDIAPGEKIYSSRFMGERAYMVTFKKVDPFYVIDLSNPEKPEILGYLKIPGYSDYLHLYDENHVIGIGKDARDASSELVSGRGLDFAWYQGIKISIFDVSDFENPVESAHYVIGDRGSDSSALYDHKAFLFDKEKNLLVIPISVAEIDESKYKICNEEELQDYTANQYCLTDWTYGEVVYQGAYVFDITADSLELRGKITHNEDKEYLKPAKEEEIGAKRIDSLGNNWEKIAVNAWKTDAKGLEYETYTDNQVDYFPNGYETGRSSVYDYNRQIQRSLFMDDNLYTVSQGMIKANDLNNLDEINSVEISQSYNYPYPILY